MRLVTFRYPSKLGTHIGALRDDGAVLDLAAADPALAGGHMPSYSAGSTAARASTAPSARSAPMRVPSRSRNLNVTSRIRLSSLSQCG